MSENVNAGTQVEVETPTDGFAVVEVTAVLSGPEYLGDRVYSTGEIRFTDEDISEVYDYE